MNKTLPLPLAEKTRIVDWGFENLSLQEVQIPKIDVSNFVPKDAKNAIVVCNGDIIHKNLENSIIVDTLVPLELVKESNRLISLNMQNFNSCLNVKVAKNFKPEEPLYITYIAKGRSLVHRSLITLETGSQLELVETFVSDEKINANIIGKVNIMPNANLRASTINSLNGESVVYYHKITEVDEFSSLESANFIINNSNVVVEDFTHLIGDGSEANVATVALANNKQKQNITIRVENLAPYSNGNIINYGVVKDDAHLAFNGIGKIHKGMNGGDNQQESRVLNLSRTAEAIANPFLLIDEGDITAGHAASIGQIDEDQVYYLMSRGMSKAVAEKLIVSGFLVPFVKKIRSETLTEQLLNSIEKKLS